MHVLIFCFYDKRAGNDCSRYIVRSNIADYYVYCQYFWNGGSSVIARLLGEEKKKEAVRTMNFCVYAMVFSGVITLVLGLIFLQPLANMSGADADNMAYTCDYLKWIFIGTPFIILANGFVHLFRSAGLIKAGTIGLVLGNVINMEIGRAHV